MLLKCEEENKDVSHSGFKTDNECINESEISSYLFSGSTNIR